MPWIFPKCALLQLLHCSYLTLCRPMADRSNDSLAPSCPIAWPGHVSLCSTFARRSLDACYRPIMPKSIPPFL